MSGLGSSLGVGQYQAAERHVATWPLGTLRDSSLAGFVACPGRNTNATLLTDPTVSTYGPARAIAKGTGRASFAGDFGGNIWGNPTAISRVTTGLTYFRSTFGVNRNPVVLLGQSMGALTALNWARANPASVAAVVLIIPVLNLQDVVTNNRGGYAAEINASYSGGYTNTTYGAAHNPAIYGGTDLAGMPIQIWYASDDVIAIPSSVTAFASAVGTSAELHNVGALGHTAAAVAAVDTSQALSFLETA